MSKNWKLIEKSEIKNKVLNLHQKISWALIRYIFSWFKLIFLSQRKDMWMYVLPILNVKFPSLFKFKHPNSVVTMKENKNCSLVGEESFLLFWTNYDFILTTKNNFLPFIWSWRHQITVSAELVPDNVKHVDKYFYQFSLHLNKK